MKIAIHHKEKDFSSDWIEYCENNQIDYKIVNCYDNDVIDQVEDCDAVMWHFHHLNPKDVLFAQQLMYSLQAAGKKVFPDFHTMWFFDDKIAQKYLLEAIEAPVVPSYVFYDKQTAQDWIDTTDFPKVFKLRRGAGSSHVKLVNDASQAGKLVRKAFSRGFSQYDKISNLKDRWYKYQHGKNSFFNLLKGLFRFAKTTEFAQIIGPEKGYVYFQKFIPGNNYDIRVIVIYNKAFAIKRLVRKGDFRASGSGHILYERHHFSDEIIQLSFEVANRIKSKCLAIDYVFEDNEPRIVELSYGFTKEAYNSCKGYWDHDLNWHEGPFNAQGWMVESLLTPTNSEL